jgi:hypothetical protein
VGKRSKIEKHRDLARRALHERKGFGDERIREPRTVGRIGDDVPGAGLAFREKVNAPDAVAPVVQVRTDDAVAARFQDFRDMALAAGRSQMEPSKLSTESSARPC